MKMLKKIVLFVLFVFILGLLYSCQEDTTITNAAPIISGATEVDIYLFDSFDALNGVSANDLEDGNITASIQLSGDTVDTSVVGTYEIIYTVEDSAGNTTTIRRIVNVLAIDESLYPLADYPLGIDLSLLPASQKAILFSALERYLTEHLYGGIPLYYRGEGRLYSSRLSLYFDEYSSLFSYGEMYSSMTGDDSSVYMIGDQLGNELEYTLRLSYRYADESLNPWTAESGLFSEMHELFSGSLYQYEPDESGLAFDLNPQLASADPIPQDEVVENGEEVATTWIIPLRNGLRWTFHPNTNLSTLSPGYEILDASDFYDTWKYAIDHDWHRAISGGNDFISIGIQGITDYLDGGVAWDSVGIKLLEDSNSLELTFDDPITANLVKYYFANSALSVINMDIYHLYNIEYGTSPEKIASSGPYYMDEFVPNEYISYKKNYAFPRNDLYRFSGILYKYLPTDTDELNEFLRGGLDVSVVPNALIGDYSTDSRLKLTTTFTVFSLSINGFGTVENRDAFIENHPEITINEDYVPEPILGYEEMRKALYYGIDRISASSIAGISTIPSSTYFTSSTYVGGNVLVESIYGTEAGKSILEDFQDEVYMYHPDTALTYFKEAVARGIEDGFYTAGTSDEYSIIHLNLVYPIESSEGFMNYITNMVLQYETLFVDDTNFVRLTITPNPVHFPDNYYDYIMDAGCDLGIYGINYMFESIFDYLQNYSDGYFGDQMMNFGTDTSSANIPVVYQNLDGKTVYETWSYNTLIEALLGKTYVDQGIHKTTWEDPTGLFQSMIDSPMVKVQSSTEDALLPNEFFGDNTSSIILENDWLALTGFVVTMDDDSIWMYVVGQTDEGYVPYYASKVFDNIDDAMIQYISDYFMFNPTLIQKSGPLTNAEIASNAYISENYGYTSVEDIELMFPFSKENIEVYACEWSNYTSTWDDAFVVLQFGDYYIALKWL